MKSSCRAGLHRELLNSTPSTLHPIKRISGMHLKPYLKLQKKERSPDVSLELPQSPPMSHPRLAAEEQPGSAKPGLLPPVSLWKPLESPSTATTACHRNSNQSHAEGVGALPPTIHQGDSGEGPLDIWAIVKPGNTKEKIAFFAAQQWSGSGRVFAGKNKSTWDIDGRATKRRKKSLDIKKAKVHLERMREASGSCFQPEPFACNVVHCSVHSVNDSGEVGFPGRHLSVVEMVAFLEQRAGVLLSDCARNCPSASAVPAKLPGQPKPAPLPPEPFPAPEAPPEKALSSGDSSVGDGEQHAEPVRVLDMVAKLESECLKRQSEREAGSLSRNNSFRRNVGRVLLASRTLSESEARKTSPEGLNQEECDVEEDRWRSGHGSSGNENPWDRSAPGCSTSFRDALEGSPDLKLEQRGLDSSKKVTKVQHSTHPEPLCAPPHSLQSKSTAGDCTSKEPVILCDLNSDIRGRESPNVSISVVKLEAGCRTSLPSGPSFGEDSLPGKLFLLLSSRCKPPQERAPPGEVPAEACQADSQGKGTPPAIEPVGLRGSGEPPESPTEGALLTFGSSHLKRQRSHDFLETRFKIQQLLEPQQYLLFLPHHIIVKIFGFLPTRSLVALKCTCGYFKFIIEYYNIRPADSRWVRDPRYREDPCKQCKKKFTKGDVSLCRWHPKPYCQALPYGPGYWMCCHRSQKSVPGCKLGLHDNHWVPACHSFNRALHKKAREPEEDC